MSSPTNRWAARNAALTIQPPQGRRPSGISTSPTFVGRTGPPPSNRPQNPTMARPQHGRTPSTSAMPQSPKTPTARNTRRPSATAAPHAGAAVGYGSTSPTTTTQPAGSDGVTSAGVGAVGGTSSAVQNGVGSESTPLIPRAPRSHTLDGLNKPATTWTEFGVLCRSSVPSSAGLALENALSTINILVVTTLGAEALAVTGNSSLSIMVTGFPLPLALAAAFTTLAAPSYPQPEHRSHIGHILSRTLMSSMVLASSVGIFWWNIGPILRALGQPHDLVEGMVVYMRWAILVLPALGSVETMKSFMQVQNMMAAPPSILLCLSPVHTAIAIYLVHHTSMGAAGAAVATATTLWLDGILIVLFASRTRARECWDGFTSAALRDWGPVLWLAVPGASMFGSESWAFEVIALSAGRSGHVAVAAQAVISTLDNLVAMIPYAISIGIANRVGNSLGFGSRAIKRAKRSVRAGFLLEVLVSGTTGSSVLIFRHQIANFFTSDKKVADEAARAAVFVASYQIFDGSQNVGAACSRAFGRQNVGSIIHFIGYYVVGSPIGAWLGITKGWGLAGLWAGAAIALACTSSAELGVAFSINWEEEVLKVQMREIESDEEEEESEDDA